MIFLQENGRNDEKDCLSMPPVKQMPIISI